MAKITRKEWVSITEEFMLANYPKLTNRRGRYFRLRLEDTFRVHVFAQGITCLSIDKDTDSETFINNANEAFGAELREPAYWGNKGVMLYFAGGLPTQEAELVELLSTLEDVYKESNITGSKSSAKDRYNKPVEEDTFYQNVVTKIQLGMQLQDKAMFCRSTLGFDNVDEFITVGASVNRTEDNSYREHVVPCDFITNSAIEMLENGSSKTEVALMVKQNLAIVLITKEEARTLDVDLGLKTDMPNGWAIGDDVLARLTAANIKTI